MILKILIAISIISVCFLISPAEARNEYLNNGYNSCRSGEVEVRIDQDDRNYKYRDYNYTDNYDGISDDRRVTLSFRKFLGSACTDEFKELQMENMNLKQQLELFKMCGKVNRNPSLELNQNFNLLVAKCKGIMPTSKEKDQERPQGNHWENLKNQYIKENPGDYMGTKLLLPKDFEGPLPEPTK